MKRKNDTDKKIAVLFPGIGYTCLKPILYYGGKLASEFGYEVVQVPYRNFPSKVKGDRTKMEQCFYMALEQSEEILKSIDWKEYDEILFLSKSVGTIVSSAYAKKYKLKVRSCLFTPLKDTFSFVGNDEDAIAFHGTGDGWADTKVLQEECEKRKIPLYLYENANHSLEVGDCMKDLEIIKRVFEVVKDWI